MASSWPKEGTLMRIKQVIVPATLVGFAATLSFGCSQGTQVQLAPAPVVKETPAQELPKVRKGGGSGLMKKNPGGNF
jgi:hypothetical protein